MARKLLAFPILAAVLALTACGASYESIAEKCGGSGARVFADDSGITAEVGYRGLPCVIDELLPEQEDQDRMDRLINEGYRGEAAFEGLLLRFHDLDGYSVFFKYD